MPSQSFFAAPDTLEGFLFDAVEQEFGAGARSCELLLIANGWRGLDLEPIQRFQRNLWRAIEGATRDIWWTQIAAARAAMRGSCSG